MESAPGEGSRFYFTLPIAPAQSPEGPQEAVDEARSHAPLLLIASHQAAWREDLSRFLEGEGFRAVSAASGSDTLHKSLRIETESDPARLGNGRQERLGNVA